MVNSAKVSNKFADIAYTLILSAKMVTADMLEKEFKYFQEHQDEFLVQHRGKFIVIKGNEVLGVYDSQLEAYERTAAEHQPGTFLIQKVEPGTDAYTQAYRSRETFQIPTAK